MKMRMRWISGAVVCACLSSCGMVSNSVKALSLKAKGLSGNKLNDGQHSVYGQGGTGSLADLNRGRTRVSSGELTPESEIIWAPEDPNIPIAELEGVEINKKPKDNWLEEYEVALRESRITGKPVLLWFTSSRNSPFCKMLSAELFSTKEFETWSAENVVLLRIDSNTKAFYRDRELKERTEYVSALKKRYRAAGNPVVVLISPRGTEITRERGYKPGQHDYLFGILRNRVKYARRDYNTWKTEMEKKGYRVWHDTQGRSVFAKIQRYHEGTIWLVEPDGKRARTHERKLSNEDRSWIEAEKAKAAAKNTNQ